MASHTTSEAPNTVTLLVDIAEFMIANPPHIMFPRPQRQVLVQSSSSLVGWCFICLPFIVIRPFNKDQKDHVAKGTQQKKKSSYKFENEVYCFSKINAIQTLNHDTQKHLGHPLTTANFILRKL